MHLLHHVFKLFTLSGLSHRSIKTQSSGFRESFFPKAINALVQTKLRHFQCMIIGILACNTNTLYSNYGFCCDLLLFSLFCLLKKYNILQRSQFTLMQLTMAVKAFCSILFIPTYSASRDRLTKSVTSNIIYFSTVEKSIRSEKRVKPPPVLRSSSCPNSF